MTSNNGNFTGTLTSQNFSSNSITDNGGIYFNGRVQCGSTTDTTHNLVCYYPTAINNTLNANW